MIKILLFILCCCCINFEVDAATYTSDTNLFENSYTNNLIDMAESQIENFNNRLFLIFQNSYDYYLVSADKDNVTVTGNRVVLSDSDIVRVLRIQNGYNYTYQYSSLSESSTTVNVNSIVVSNIDTAYSVRSKRYQDYSNDYHIVNLLKFILGIAFAIFVTKERSYI